MEHSMKLLISKSCLMKIVHLTWQQMFVTFMLINPTSVPAQSCQKALEFLPCSPDPTVTCICGELLKSLEPVSAASLLPHGA